MRWIMIAIVAAFLLSTFLMYDGGRRGRPEPREDGSMQDYVVAVVNGQELLRSNLDAMVRNYIQQSNIRDIVSTDVPLLYKAALDNAIFQTELDKEVGARDISVSEEEITAQVNTMAEGFPTREAFFQYMERSGIKMDDLRNDIKRQISTNKTIEMSLALEPMSADALLEFYDMTKPIFFSQPSGFMFDIAHFIDKQPASILRAKLDGKASNWGEILSEDISSADVIRATEAPSFMSEAALSADEKWQPLLTLEVEKVSPVIEMSSLDYMVAVKREVIEGKIVPFDEVSGEIRAMLEQQQSRNAFEKYSKELIGRANVVIEDHALFPTPVSVDVASSDVVSADAE